MKLQIKAGKHERYYAPVWVKAPADAAELPAEWAERLRCGKGTGYLRAGETLVPAQVVNTPDGRFIVFIVPYMPAGAELTYEFAPGTCESSVRLVPAGDDRLDLLVQSQRFGQYVYSSQFAKPFWGPLQAPGVDAPITRLDLEIREHPHQRSLWFSHGDVNGVDCWNEPAGRHGKEVHQEFTHVTEGGVVGYFVSTNTWTDFSGQPLMEDTRSMALYNLWEGQRLLDLTLVLRAEFGPVVLGPTKEAGPLGIRVAPELTGPRGGTIVNAYGAIGEKECWGKRAPWCDYYGLVQGHRVGIAIFDHPDNADHPTYWHVREYGLFAANNFHFVGARRLEKGEQMSFRYRVLFHSGDAARAQVAERYHDFATPIAANWVE